MRQGGLGQQGHGSFKFKSLHIVHALHEMHGFGGDRHGAHCLVVALMADIDDLESFARADLGLVMHLGNQRTYGIDHKSTITPRRRHHRRSGAMGTEHQGGIHRHLGDVVHEHHAHLAKAVHYRLVVHDLVIAVHRRLVHTHHPGQGLDGHLDPGAESPGSHQQHTVHVHRARVSGPLTNSDLYSRWGR